jgi:hypothetical protein
MQKCRVKLQQRRMARSTALQLVELPVAVSIGSAAYDLLKWLDANEFGKASPVT